jgi:hypothetical protein
MLFSRQQNTGQNQGIKISNRCLIKVADFTRIGTRVTNQNSIEVKIKRRLNLGNASYHSVQNLLPLRLLSKNTNIRIYKTTYNFVCGSVWV